MKASKRITACGSESGVGVWCCSMVGPALGGKGVEGCQDKVESKSISAKPRCCN